MEGLFSFLLFAGLFYFMIRHGCGAHMTHGHHEKKTEKTNTIDPVCGREINVDKGYGKLQEGNLFRFCSRQCLDEFDKDPEKFIKQTSIISNKKNDHET